jgi:hypothetical protein
MKPQATYQCGHESTKEFDCRSSIARSDAAQWPAKAAVRDCPKCRKEKILFKIATLTPDQMRNILRGFASDLRVSAEIEEVWQAR